MKLDQQIKAVLQNVTPVDLTPVQLEVQKGFENIKDYHEGKLMIAKKREEYPDEGEFLDALEDDLRERFLRKSR